MKQLDIIVEPEQVTPLVTALPERARKEVLQLIARLLLEVVLAHDEGDPRGQGDE